MPGVEGRRVVASGGGTRVHAWMAGVADATGLPVDTVAVPEGAAYGAAFVARVAAGLEPSLDGSQAVGPRGPAGGARPGVGPAPPASATGGSRSSAPGPEGGGAGGRAAGAARLPGAYPLGVKATLRAPLSPGRASARMAPRQSSSGKRWVSIGVMSSRPAATRSR